MVRDACNEAGKAIANVLKAKKDATEGDLIAAVDAAVDAVEQKLLIIDSLGHYHMNNCAKAKAFGGGARRGKGQQGPSRNEITFKEAVEQDLLPATCCYTRVMEEKAKMECEEKAKPGAKAAGRKFSPLDIVGGADPKQRRAFLRWLKSLSEEERVKAMEALQELDSHEEFVGFMSLPPNMRMSMIGLLENRHGKFALKRWLSLLGAAVNAGFTNLANSIKASYEAFLDWDKQFEARAQAVRAAREVPVKQRIEANRRARHVPWSPKMFSII
jgi:hypothetical protein